MQKSVEAAMVARETFPEATFAADKKQANRDQKLLLASLERYLHHPSPPCVFRVHCTTLLMLFEMETLTKLLSISIHSKHIKGQPSCRQSYS